MPTQVVSFVICLIFIPGIIAVLPTDYVSKTAEEKQNILWVQIENSPYTPAPLPKTNPTAAESMALFTAKFVNQAFTYDSDEEPPGRKRLIHTYGTVAKIELVMFPNSTFTGLYESGGIGLVRLSLGTYDLEKFLPGMVFKILIDGRPSLNFFSINGLDDQGTNHNFFAKPFNSVIANPHDPQAMALGASFGASLKSLPGGPMDKPESAGNLGLYEAASEDCHGVNVTGHIKTPYQIVYKPNSKLGWDPNTKTDFRVSLANIPENSVLCGIYAKASPTATKEEYVGQLVTRSPFMGSHYGDETLFLNTRLNDGGPRSSNLYVMFLMSLTNTHTVAVGSAKTYSGLTEACTPAKICP